MKTLIIILEAITGRKMKRLRRKYVELWFKKEAGKLLEWRKSME